MNFYNPEIIHPENELIQDICTRNMQNSPISRIQGSDACVSQMKEIFCTEFHVIPPIALNQIFIHRRNTEKQILSISTSETLYSVSQVTNQTLKFEIWAALSKLIFSYPF